MRDLRGRPEMTREVLVRPMRFLVLGCCGLAVWLALGGAVLAGGVLLPQKPLPKVDLSLGVKIPVRDGVQLNATVYRPANVDQAVPAIVHITPYASDNY